jgi:hypothetical protein
MTLLAVSIYLIIIKLIKKSRNRIDEKQYNGQIPIGLLLGVADIIILLFMLYETM